MEICHKCGLPEQACVCEQIVKTSQKINVVNEKKRYGKIVTIISGFDKKIDIKKIAKKLKNEFACGGTAKKGIIELQGDHSKKIKEILIKIGFDGDSIN